MADTLIDLIKAVGSSGPKPELKAPQGRATDADNTGSPLSAQVYDPLDVGTDDLRPAWFPEVPAEATDGNVSPENPARPGGALEILSVVQVRGDTGGKATPCVVRTYPIRGNVT